MGVLLPEDLALSSLGNDAERTVVAALRDRLSDGWVVLPNVQLSERTRDYELDVVLAHPDNGVVVVEVKGHRPTIRDGVWRSHDEPMQPQPVSQARSNAYALRELLRGLDGLEKVGVDYAIAFPNVDAIDGVLPNDADGRTVTSGDLDDPSDAIALLQGRRARHRLIGDAGVQRIVEHLRPDCDFVADDEARARLARARLDELCRQQVEALSGLDANRRVCVTGGAGTGKTYLATLWVRRARLRGERVLFTCFNVPLADTLRDAFVLDAEVTIGTFHEIGFALDGMPPIERAEVADAHWWNEIATPHLVEHFAAITEAFDTIVVDEAQDFDPVWIDLLGSLLDPAGPRRLMLVADEAQAVYERGFEPPGVDAGWTRCRLESNCRNTWSIASLLQRRFDGALAPVGGPEAQALHIVPVDDLDATVDAVGDAIDTLEDDGHGAQRIVVATFTSSVRDRLRDQYALVRWEDREPMAIVCENVHRIKGLEFDHVILVLHDDDVTDELLYVGLSRAVISATVIGPESRVGALA